jgi:hypothetical protein
MKTKPAFYLAGIVFLSLCCHSLSAQILKDLNVDSKRSAFDSLVSSIRVPEIDPRQYIIIYEWNESNEKVVREGIQDEYRLKVIGRFQNLINDKLQEYETAKAKANQLEVEFYNSSSQLEKLDKEYQELREMIDLTNTELDRLKNEEPDATMISELTEKKSELIKKEAQLIMNSNSVAIANNRLLEKVSKAFEQLQLLEKEAEELKVQFKKLDYQRDYIHWQHQPETDSTKFKNYKPFDFFDEVGKEYPGLTETYQEYYNHIVWRNAGTPDWEPIWWLNQYPWPNLDYRNIDLLDQDYRDNSFALIPYQKYKVIDYKSVLRIVFDKNQLARNEDFKGSIGLDAFLYDGNKVSADPREIEINPYSVIGEARKSIGLLNRPAGELADNLFFLIYQARKISRYPVNSLFDDYLEPLVIEMKGHLADAEKVLALQKDTLDQRELTKYQRNIEDFCDLINEIEDGVDFNFSVSCRRLSLIKRDDNRDTQLEELKKFRGQLDSLNSKNKIKNFNENVKRVRDLREEIRLVMDFLNYFKEEVGNTQDAFLKLIGRDKITFDHLVGRIENKVDSIDVELASLRWIPESSSVQDIEKFKDTDLRLGDYLSSLPSLMYGLSNFTGSPLDNAINKLWQMEYTDEFSDDEDYYHPGGFLSDFEKLTVIFEDTESRDKLREYIAEKAGEILYQDLIYGTIDLDLADAQDGDLLFIRMFWDKDPINDSSASEPDPATGAENAPVTTNTARKDGVALYVAKFQLTKTGWSFSTSDNSMLVKRVNENLLRTNYPLSPSDFKLTGGAAITWGLKNDYRVKKKIRFDKETSFPLFDNKGRLKYNKFAVSTQKTVKWLEPSLGVNFSYLDFSTARNFELGVGPTLGFFDNVIYFSAGWNLMELEERPFYFGIGASFVNIGTKVTSSKSAQVDN